MARCGSRRPLTQVDGAIIAAKLNNVTNPDRRHERRWLDLLAPPVACNYRRSVIGLMERPLLIHLRSSLIWGLPCTDPAPTRNAIKHGFVGSRFAECICRVVACHDYLRPFGSGPCRSSVQIAYRRLSAQQSSQREPD